MRDARQRQEKMVETIVKQRDMYRLAAGGHTLTNSPNKNNQQHSMVPFNNQNSDRELTAQLEAASELESSLRSRVSELERELARACAERDIMKQVKDQFASEASHREERTAAAMREAASEAEKARYLKARIDQVQLLMCDICPLILFATLYPSAPLPFCCCCCC